MSNTAFPMCQTFYMDYFIELSQQFRRGGKVKLFRQCYPRVPDFQKVLPKSWLCNNAKHKEGDSYGEKRKSGFISLPGREGTQ